MGAFYSDHFVLPLPEGHRFPMEKYGLLRERVSVALELTVSAAATSARLAEVHDRACIRRALEGTLTRDQWRGIGFHIELPDGAKDDAYLSAVAHGLPAAPDGR